MKKFLLVVAAAIIAVSASAQVSTSLKVNPKPFESTLKTEPIAQVKGFSGVPNLAVKQLNIAGAEVQPINKAPQKKVVTPAGTPKWYTMNAYCYSWYGVYYYTGLADQVSTDGNDIYVKTLFPASYSELWAKGTLNEAGDEVTFPDDEYIGVYYDTYDLAPVELVLSEDGNSIEGYKELVMKKDGDRIYVDDDVDNPTRYIALGAFLDGEFAGYLTYSLCLDLNPVEQELNQVVVPETATETKYAYSYSDSYGAKNAALGTVAVDGNDVYFDHLALGYGWVKGTRDGNTVLVPSGQFLGGDTGYFTFFNCCKNFGTDDDYNTTYDLVDNFSLTVDGDVYTQTNEEETPTLLTTDGTVYDYTYGYEIKPYAGAKPAVPSDPSSLFIYDYTSYYGQYCFGGSTPNVDVNGDYMDPNCMEVSIWEDGDILTFTADDGYSLSEDVDWMPYGWMDDNGGYDLAYYSLSPYFYLYESLFTELGMQVRYTVDGVTNYSNVVYIDLDGNTRTDYVGTIATGINNVNTTSNSAIYNLAGQRVSNNFKGIVIKNGKKFMK